MSVVVQQVQDKNLWEQALRQWDEANFLQSWNWGEFHKALGKEVFPLQVLDGDRVVGAALTVLEKAKRGTYLTIAGGPLLLWKDSQVSEHLSALVAYLQQVAQQTGAVFARVRVQEVESPELHQLLLKHGLCPSPMHLTADLTLQLDVTKTEEELLMGMRKNTRYEVRQAEKMGLRVEFSKDPAEMELFYQHQVAVAARQKFVPFSKKFLEEQFKAFLADDQVLLIHSFDKSTLLATAFVIFYGNEAVYHYGISSDENYKMPGSYACQWAAIKEAKRRGMKRYNFWGVAPADEPNHRFAGVGIFKRGFGGEEVAYLPAYDLPFSWKYPFVRAFEMWRKKLRKL